MTEGAGLGMRQQARDGQVGAGVRFIVAGRRASLGTGLDRLRLIPAAQLYPTALLLIPAAMDAGPLRECADQPLVDRWRGRSD